MILVLAALTGEITSYIICILGEKSICLLVVLSMFAMITGTHNEHYQQMKPGNDGNSYIITLFEYTSG